MSAERQAAALLALVEADRARQCDAIDAEARSRADAIVREAHAAARARMRAAFAEERGRMEARVAAGNVVDGTRAGLLADRAEIGALLLAALEAR